MSSAADHALFDALKAHDLSRAHQSLLQGADPNATDADGWRPLHHAIGQVDAGGSVEFVQLLLERGADPNAWDANHHETPLVSASEPQFMSDLEVVRILLQRGADPNVRRSDGESPLRLAVQGKDVERARLLLEHGAAATLDDFGGDRCWTALGHAAHNFDVPMIRLLLEAGADPQREDDVGDTARDKLPPREAHDPALWDEVMELLGRRPPTEHT